MKSGIDLYWIPLGAGGRFVRLNGRAYEAIKSRLEGRPSRDLYHSALRVYAPEGTYVIEMTPAGRAHEDRGVVGVGSVGANWAGRFRLFRYELRCWLGGSIPDIGEAVASPIRLSEDPAVVRKLLYLVPAVPRLTWGRDELGAGDMWNSNSQIACLLALAGLEPQKVAPPPNGRAPGWEAGLLAARRVGRRSGANAGDLRRPSSKARRPRGADARLFDQN